MFHLCHFTRLAGNHSPDLSEFTARTFSGFWLPCPIKTEVTERRGSSVINWEFCPNGRGGERCWYTCVSNMYLHDCVRLAGRRIAPDAKRADGGAHVFRRLGFRGLAIVPELLLQMHTSLPRLQVKARFKVNHIPWADVYYTPSQHRGSGIGREERGEM